MESMTVPLIDSSRSTAASPIGLGLCSYQKNAVNSGSAVPISGSIGFTGSFDIWDDDTASLVNDFTVGEEILIGSDAAVTGTVTGSFADEGINAGDSVSHSDIIYDPTGPINDLWSVGTFTMDVTTVNVDFISSSSIILSGSGNISSTDVSLDDTAGTWLFSANTLGANFTWSSSSTLVPIPPDVWLFSSGLLGMIGITGRRQSN
jgi:hypothetical protein